MKFFTRLGNGWSLGMASLAVIRKNKQLILFPIISGVALLFVLASFMGFMFAGNNFDIGESIATSETADYIITFGFYLFSYFIIVFFNMGLVHCTRIYLQGGTPTFQEGLKFSLGKFPVILGWAMVSATVGLVLKAIEENSGTVGQIISNIIGAVWSVITFFVVPVLAYEDISPITAIKRSGQIMKQKWGESLGASFSFGVVTFVGLILIALPLGLVFGAINPVLGISAGIFAALLIQSIVSAAEVVFVASVYHSLVKEEPVEHFEPNTLDGLFVKR